MHSISHFPLLPDTSSHSHMLILFGIQQCPSLIRSVACLVHILIFDRRAEGAFHLGGVAAQWGAAILPAMTVTRMAKQPNTRSVNKQNMAENRSTGLSYHLSSLKWPFWVQLWVADSYSTSVYVSTAKEPLKANVPANEDEVASNKAIIDIHKGWTLQTNKHKKHVCQKSLTCSAC